MPQLYLQEFRDDIVRVVMGRDKNTTVTQIAMDLSIRQAPISKWSRARGHQGGRPFKMTPAQVRLTIASMG